MYTVYILQNSFTNRFYIGTTSNIDRRIAEHNRGQTKSTKSLKGTWSFIFKEVFESHKDALRREKLIKSYKGGNGFKKLVGTLG